MKLVPTRRTDYGIRAMIYLAQQTTGELSKADDIADAMQLPRNFLPRVLQDLQRARLVHSRPGGTGGYALSRPPEEISILDIVEALEGSLANVDCALRGGPCRWNDVCALHWVWSEARAALAASLRAGTLARVADDDRRISSGSAEVPADTHRRRQSGIAVVPVDRVRRRPTPAADRPARQRIP